VGFAPARLNGRPLLVFDVCRINSAAASAVFQEAACVTGGAIGAANPLLEATIANTSSRVSTEHQHPWWLVKLDERYRDDGGNRICLLSEEARRLNLSRSELLAILLCRRGYQLFVAAADKHVLYLSKGHSLLRGGGGGSSVAEGQKEIKGRSRSVKSSKETFKR